MNINDANEIKMTTGSAPNSTQPLILGNVNAANLLTSHLTSSQNNNVLIPTNVMTLPVSGTSNQVIGILPIILHSSQTPGGLDPSQVIEINNDFNRSENNCTDGCVASQPMCHSNSVQVQSNLVSSDTLILSSSESKLSSADTIPLISSSSDILKRKCPVEQLPIKQETTTPLQTTFSLVSALSNRSVDLDSIPTINLFKPEVIDSKETVRNQVTVSASSLISRSSSTMKNSDVPSKGYETRSKRRGKVTNRSEDFDVEMDIDTDTEAEDVCYHGAGSERKENSLTRDDTVILPDASTQNHSSLTASDTLIISSDSKFEPTLATSTGIPVEFSMSGGVGTHLNPVLTVSGGNVISSQPPIPSLPSIPSLMLTDSIVEGTVNPTLLCDFLSQSSENPVRIQSIKSISLDQITSVENLNLIASLQSMTQRPLIVSSQNSIQGMSLQNSNPGIPSSVTLNTSVKGTQTDWVLGSLPVSVIPNNIPQTVEETSQQQVEVEETDVEQQHVDVDDATADHEELPFPCAQCGQKFSSKIELQNHEKSAHKKTFKCDLCNSTFTRLGNYTRHRKIHNLKPDVKHYNCTECGREFLQRCDLKRHLLIHSNQQPHRCELCGKGYIRHGDLVVHMRFHNKEKNFQCNLCDKTYFQSGDLNRHIRRTHKPTSLLTCGHCERKYAGEVTLIRHMKVVHKDIILNSVNKLDAM